MTHEFDEAVRVLAWGEEAGHWDDVPEEGWPDTVTDVPQYIADYRVRMLTPTPAPEPEVGPMMALWNRLRDE